MKQLTIIGRGKLGQAVAASASSVFSTTLIGHADVVQDRPIAGDIIVCAVPGNDMAPLVLPLMHSRRQVIIASTGYQADLIADVDLRAQGVTWVAGANFSLGMQALRHAFAGMVGVMEQMPLDVHGSMIETHDVSKVDAPSGTALLWQAWMSDVTAIQIESRRVPNASPSHELSLRLAFEDICIRHEAADRRPFAEGIVWLARHMTAGHIQRHGLLMFEDVFDASLARRTGPAI